MAQSVLISRFGGPELLEIQETQNPVLLDDGFLITVKACGVNFADIMMRMGLYPEAPKRPFTPGYEFSGIITQKGAKAAGFEVGDRVFGMVAFGAQSSQLSVLANQIRKLPDHLSFAEGAAIPVTFLTAWVCLHEMARVRPGDRVLIQGAAGGVGLAAVQMAKLAGAVVTGQVGSAEKFEIVRTFGADTATTYEDFCSGPFEIILDSQSGASVAKNMAHLAPLGRVIAFGVSSAAEGSSRSLLTLAKWFLNTPRFSPIQLAMKNAGIFGLNMLPLQHSPELMSRAFDGVYALFDQKKLRVHVHATFALTEVAKAHQLLQSRKTSGKIVLQLDKSS